MREKRSKTGAAATTTTVATTTASSNSSKSIIKTVNPATGRIIREYEIMAKEQIKEKARASKEAFSTGRETLTKERISCMSLHIFLKRTKKSSRRQLPLKWEKPSRNQSLKYTSGPGRCSILQIILKHLLKIRL